MYFTVNTALKNENTMFSYMPSHGGESSGPVKSTLFSYRQSDNFARPLASYLHNWSKVSKKAFLISNHRILILVITLAIGGHRHRS